MKTLTFMAALLVAQTLTVASYAQLPGRGFDRPKDKEETTLDRERRKVDEKAYKDSLSQNPNKDKDFDPWASVREKPVAEKPPVVKKKPTPKPPANP